MPKPNTDYCDWWTISTPDGTSWATRCKGVLPTQQARTARAIYCDMEACYCPWCGRCWVETDVDETPEVYHIGEHGEVETYDIRS